MVPISLKQRLGWVTVAEHTALTMNSMAFDFEKETYAQLNKLEKLVNEI
jgi:hypothetical protein